MPQNPIQFQQGMSLSELIDCYGTEAKCEAAVFEARWPQGFLCPECGARGHSCFLVEGRRYWQCAHCRTQTALRSGTLFHASRLPTGHRRAGQSRRRGSGRRHLRRHHRHAAPPQRSRPFRWVNAFIANLKTAIRGTYHQFNFRKCSVPERYRSRTFRSSGVRFGRRLGIHAQLSLQGPVKVLVRTYGFKVDQADPFIQRVPK